MAAYIRKILGQLFLSDPSPTHPHPAAPKITHPEPDEKPREPKPRPSAVDSPQTSVRAGQPPGKNRFTPKPQDQPPAWSLEDFAVPVREDATRFHDLGLPDHVLHAVADVGFQYCTPIQAAMLPGTLAGKDAFGRAQTGTGKTAAFLITILKRFHDDPGAANRKPGAPRALVLAPTRELVMQIVAEAKALSKYSSLHIAAVFGGMDYEKQRRELVGNRADMVVATPGRLLDFLRKKQVFLNQVSILIIDEADRMLDMGFIPDVSRIISFTPPKTKRQTMLFSATLTPTVMRMAAQWTVDPLSVEIEPEQVAADSVEQVVYITTTDEKFNLLYNYIVQKDLTRVIVFCNRRDETRSLVRKFMQYRINCAVLSGDVQQKQRVTTLENFKLGHIRVLVATDVAGRGIHIEGMDHVINYTLPHDPEDYVHRIGRTGRAGASGTSLSFACEDDSFYIPAIEEFMGRELICIRPPEELLAPIAPPPPSSPQKKRRPPRRPPSGAQRHGEAVESTGVKPSQARRPRRRRRPSGTNKPAAPESHHNSGA
ncbi:MAG: DEAD/DEAH box helicase [Thermodesulfobacteriota bacterium]